LRQPRRSCNICWASLSCYCARDPPGSYPRSGPWDSGEPSRLIGHRADDVDVMGPLDLFSLPSIDRESCHNALLEAMPVALPAVESDVGGVDEMLVEGETGRLLPSGDSGELANTVVGVLSDSVGGREIYEAGRQRTECESSLTAELRDTLAV
jgi:glycosyltransferase involved in cell wall biosynthesis